MKTRLKQRLQELSHKPALRPVFRWGPVLLDAVKEDTIFLRASALTYTTVLSIVPFLAVAFSVLKGFGIQNTDFIRDLLLRLAAGREQVVDHIITYINKTNVSTLGAVGVGFLFVTAVMLISNIENTLNSLWGVTRGRSWARKVTDYVSTILIVPIFMVVAMSISATVRNNEFVQALLSHVVLGTLYVVLLKLVPFVLMWAVLTFIYLMLPNTKVRFMPAFLGAVVAGTTWQLAQWAYISFQLGAAKYNAIYGSFAQLPLFLIWVYLSWVIVLLGAEVCYVLQNARSLEIEAKFETVSPAQKVQLALQSLVRIGRAFLDGERPMSIESLAAELRAPVLVLRRILARLVEERMVSRVEADTEAYVLQQSPHNIRVKDVIDSFMHEAGRDLPLRQDGIYAPLRRQLEKLEGITASSEHNLSLSTLLERQPEPDQ